MGFPMSITGYHSSRNLDWFTRPLGTCNYHLPRAHDISISRNIRCAAKMVNLKYLGGDAYSDFFVPVKSRYQCGQCHL